MKTCMRLFGAPHAQQEASSSLEMCLRIVSDTCMARQDTECPEMQTSEHETLAAVLPNGLARCSAAKGNHSLTPLPRVIAPVTSKILAMMIACPMDKAPLPIEVPKLHHTPTSRTS